MATKTKTPTILEGGWLDLRVKVDRTWPDGRVTVIVNDAGGNGRKHTIREDSDDIVAVHKPG